MSGVQHIIFLDLSVFIMMIVLANLSRRIGEAMEKPPYYKLLYGASILVALAAVISTITANLSTEQALISQTIPMGMRCFAGLLSVFSTLQYWQWLFSASNFR
ncbi:MAG: hypothetical protein JW795_07280 [Chitinivibrionales bacterium]|nr:hypothetical protein [Chitinivibrionales bacterium]